MPEAYNPEAHNCRNTGVFGGTIQNLLPNVHLEVNGLCSGRFCLNETQFYGIFNTRENFERFEPRSYFKSFLIPVKRVTDGEKGVK